MRVIQPHNERAVIFPGNILMLTIDVPLRDVQQQTMIACHIFLRVIIEMKVTE